MQLHKKRQSINSELRKHKHAQLFDSIRETLVLTHHHRIQSQQNMTTFYLAYLQLQKEEANKLNLYANLQDLIEKVLGSRQSDALQKKVAIWLYISLTSDFEVMSYLASQRLPHEWKKLLFYLSEYSRFEEDFFERMTILLSLSQLNSNQHWKHQLLHIKMTALMLEIEPPSDQDSSYFDLLEAYISMVPKDHLHPIISSGFALRSLQFSSNGIFFSIIARIQAQAEKEEEFKDMLEILLTKKAQIECNLLI